MATLDHSSLALQRTKDLYAHDIAAGKELQDAAQDYASAESDLADKISRLRAAGIDPAELRKTPPGTMWQVAEVPETQIAFVKIHAKATVVFSSYPGKTFSGHVGAIGAVIDPVTRTIKVRIVLENANGELRPAMYGTAQFEEGRTDAIPLPRSAVVNVQGKAFVFAETAPGTFHRKEIAIGAETKDDYIVNAGLKPNDVVASSGVIL